MNSELDLLPCIKPDDFIIPGLQSSHDNIDIVISQSKNTFVRIDPSLR